MMIVQNQPMCNVPPCTLESAPHTPPGHRHTLFTSPTSTQVVPTCTPPSRGGSSPRPPDRDFLLVTGTLLVAWASLQSLHCFYFLGLHRFTDVRLRSIGLSAPVDYCRNQQHCHHRAPRRLLLVRHSLLPPPRPFPDLPHAANRRTVPWAWTFPSPMVHAGTPEGVVPDPLRRHRRDESRRRRAATTGRTARRFRLTR